MTVQPTLPPARAAGTHSLAAPPRLDWDRAPWNRWSFQHVRELVPTVEVWKGGGPAAPLPRAERDLDAIGVLSVSGEPSTLSALLEETYTDGFLVLKDGAVAYERYFNGMTPRTLHLSQSMAKSVTAAVAGILVGRGLLDTGAPITDYLPELADTAWKGATLQQVLDMTTGVPFSEEYEDPYSEIGQVDVASGWKPIPPDADPAFHWPETMWELILSLKQADRSHGEKFEYRSIETDVLAFAMERAAGKCLAELVSEEIWQKIGAEESACFTVDAGGYALADGGFNASLRDYGRFGQMILEDGAGIVPSQWIEATRNGPSHGPEYSLSMPEASYRNFFWIEDPRSRNLMCRGVFGQLIHVNFDALIVVVKLSSWPDFSNAEFSARTLQAVHAIAEALK